ncbi:hypothetical protein TW65_09192 [Stemphylium lycopersici]|nr:hypothetical protein TW65_09192 [Stemphylium lycopersici]
MSDSNECGSFEVMQLRWQHLQSQPPQFCSQEHNYENTQDPYLGHWPNSNVVAQPSAHPQHFSASSFSSTVPSYRSSNNSAFSGSSLRGSVASSVSDWSHSSSMSRDQHVLQTEYLLSNGPSAQVSYTPSPIEDVESLTAKGRPAKKPVAQEKDYFKTCVSANKQSRTCSKEYKYFCTSCGRPFVEKADWKRHEETFQERPEMFQCDLCPAIYFLDKDFTAHHVKHSTGRVEGYPDSNPNPQLQDYLEYYTSDQNATLLAHLAYRKMVKHPPPSHSPAPPPVPPKDHRGKALQDLTEDTDSWTQFINTVVEDNVPPQGVCHMDSWYDS